jgi:hypothetical protein
MGAFFYKKAKMRRPVDGGFTRLLFFETILQQAAGNLQFPLTYN